MNLLQASVWTLALFTGDHGAFGVSSDRKQTSAKVTSTTLHHNSRPTPPTDTDPANHHATLLKILRDSKIKQNRQWAEGQPCPSGWLLFNDSCYWGSTYPLSWFAAEHECRSFGYDAHLASVHGSDENLRVQAMAGCGAPWIGLTKMNPTQSSNPTVGWAWTDTSPNDFFAWRPGSPVGTDERNCAFQDKGTAAAGGSGWANGYCTELRVFTCKADAKINGVHGQGEETGGGGGPDEPPLREPSGTTKPHPKPKRSATKARQVSKGRDDPMPPNSESPRPCPAGGGWIDGKNGFCYFYSSTKANWFQAEATCKNQSAHLISIKTDVEQRLAMLGGCDRRVWLGAVRWQPEERWHWYDDLTYVGEAGGFTHWAQNKTGANYVVSFIDATGNGAGRWFDSPSPHEPMYYICKRPIYETNGGESEVHGANATGQEESGKGTASSTEKPSGTGSTTGATEKHEAGSDSEGSDGPNIEVSTKPGGATVAAERGTEHGQGEGGNEQETEDASGIEHDDGVKGTSLKVRKLK